MWVRKEPLHCASLFAQDVIDSEETKCPDSFSLGSPGPTFRVQIGRGEFEGLDGIGEGRRSRSWGAPVRSEATDYLDDFHTFLACAQSLKGRRSIKF